MNRKSSSKVNQAEPQAVSPHVVSALRRLLKPLVRFLLRNQISWPFLANLIKSIYVEVAETDLAFNGKRQSDSRLNVLTGIHRRDIKRFRDADSDPLEIPVNISVGSQAVSRWCTEKDYLDAEGHPAPLPRLDPGDGSSFFGSLVSSVSKDIRPRAILDEWLRIGVVEIDAGDNVLLRTEAFVPEKGFEEKVYYLGRNLHDHIAACEHNLEGSKPPFIERSVHYPQLSSEAVDQLQARAEEYGKDTLHKLNQLAIKLRKASKGKAESEERINFGIYFYRESSADSTEPNNQEESK